MCKNILRLKAKNFFLFSTSFAHKETNIRKYFIYDSFECDKRKFSSFSCDCLKVKLKTEARKKCCEHIKENFLHHHFTFFFHVKIVLNILKFNVSVVASKKRLSVYLLLKMIKKIFMCMQIFYAKYLHHSLHGNEDRLKNIFVLLKLSLEEKWRKSYETLEV